MGLHWGARSGRNNNSLTETSTYVSYTRTSQFSINSKAKPGGGFHSKSKMKVDKDNDTILSTQSRLEFWDSLGIRIPT